MNQHIKPPAGGDGNPTPEDRFFGRLADVVRQMQASAEESRAIERSIGADVDRFVRYFKQYRRWSVANVIIMGLNLVGLSVYLATRVWELFL